MRQQNLLISFAVLAAFGTFCDTMFHSILCVENKSPSIRYGAMQRTDRVSNSNEMK